MSLSIIIVTLTLILTQSRSGWIGILGGIIILLILWTLTLPPSRERKIFGAAVVIVLFLVAVMFARLGATRLIDVMAEPAQETAIVRW